MDAMRRGIWCFYLVGKDPTSSATPEQLGLDVSMEVCGYRLQLVEEGGFEPAALLKSRPSGLPVITTPSSSSSNGSALDITAKSGQASAAAVASAPGSGPMDLDSKPPVPNPMPDVKGYSAVPVREIHEFFISAVLSSLSASFCHQIGAIPLNHRTVLLTPKPIQSDNVNSDPIFTTPALATFRVYLTTTGTLVVSLSVALTKGLVSAAEYVRLNPLSAGASVLTAPMGAFATFASVMVDNDSGVMVQSPDTQISRYRPEPSDKFAEWRTTCSRLLQMRGMPPSLLDGCPWLNIYFVPRKPSDQRGEGKRTPLASSGPMAPWPAVLCFSKARGAARKALTAADEKNSDSVTFTGDWILAAPERDQLLAKKKKEREAAAAFETGDGDTSGHLPSAYSPLQLRGSANLSAAAAAGIMYLTPPDGIQPGVTPSFDGTVSSPGGQPIAATMADIDAALNPSAPGPDTFGDGWDGSDPKREAQNGTFLEGENLFGDLGEDVFENNELTDADFNFFDEEPGVANIGDPSFEDIDMDIDTPEIMHQPPSPVAAPEIKPEIRPLSPEFTKPELKHARSSLLEETRQETNQNSFDLNSAIGIKRHPSPFNPDVVYKRIRASLHGIPATGHGSKALSVLPRRGSVFERVDFGEALSIANKKYENKGQFSPDLPSDRSEDVRFYDTVGPLSTRNRKKIKPSPSGFSPLTTKAPGSLGQSLHHNLLRREDPPSDADDVSLVSDQDDTSDTSDEPSSPAISGMPRRRLDDDVASLAASFKDLESTAADSPAYGSIDLSRLSIPENPELAITRYFADPEPVPCQMFHSDEDCVTIAQILTDQAAIGNLKTAQLNIWDEPQEARRSLMSALRQSIHGLRFALPKALESAADCQLRPFVEVQDVPLLGNPTRMPPRPAGQELVRPNLFQIPTPHVEVRRYEGTVSLLPSSVAFWDSLGLGPADGPKDVLSVCVFPSWYGLQHSASDFLDGVASTYETLKLGTFERMPATNDAKDGLVPYDTVSESVAPPFAVPRVGSSISDQMTRLSLSLASLTHTDKNFVIYFVYDPEHPSSIVDSCSAFQELFEKYKKALSDRKKPVTNDLAMQLVPLDMVASETSMVVLAPQDAFRLCIETYDRCTLFDGPMPAPAIRLEDPLPRLIDFKLTTTPSANLLKEKSCIHIAYAQSVDGRWITAAWTDNQGNKQTAASYCLGRRGRPLTTAFTDVAHEIWETTQELISAWKVHWRVIITKCGPMDPAEVEFWVGLAQTESKAAVTLTLMTVDTSPSLQLISPLVKIPPTASAVSYSTPVSTPQPLSIVSPDQSGNPSTPVGATPGVTATTPGGENSALELEGDTTLVDTTDMTWGVVMSHRLNNSSSLTELNPALVSGYLVKRGGLRTEDPPVVMELNIVHSEGNPRVYEALLREMMGYFRALGVLARARGIVDPVTDVRPWHVAAAEKAVKVLYQLM